MKSNSPIVLAIAAAVAIAAVGAVAAYSHLPWVFPSLGPTAFILLVAPLSAPASTRSTLCGHIIGIIAGVIGLAVFGLLGEPADLEDVTAARVGAMALALGLTTGVMLALDVAHPPAAATALIVALGVLDTLADYTVMTGALIGLIIGVRLFNIARGYRPPLWNPPVGAQEP